MAYFGGLFKGVGDEIFAAANSAVHVLGRSHLDRFERPNLLCELGRRNGFETSEPGYEGIGLVFILKTVEFSWLLLPATGLLSALITGTIAARRGELTGFYSCGDDLQRLSGLEYCVFSLDSIRDWSGGIYSPRRKTGTAWS